ncbi:Transferase [Trema orientale]|uniref:Transferase n=1 Tax=Trema orientale TaxID=63057 RepID=A0A2P5BGH8_TREOI|nr:Transferase [Trema orientale]
MMINIKEMTMVKPAEETPRHALWLSNLDLMTTSVHITNVYLYRNNGAANFFETSLLKDALSKVLVPFYPLAGRFRHNNAGRLEINCNSEGVLFVVAETCSIIDDFGDFAPTTELRRLTPAIDKSGGISSFPILAVQVTYFKCGAVSLGFSHQHRSADGTAAIYFVNSWSEVTRGIDLLHPPIIDRTLLRARDPPQPVYDHIEYKPVPTMKNPKQTIKSKSSDQESPIVRVFHVTRDQVNMLKASSKENGNGVKYSSFEILASHIWKCACKARSLPDDQLTKLFTLVNGRAKLCPPLPPNFFGNVLFASSTIVTVGDLISKPTGYGATKIRQTLVQMDNNYLKSAIDYLELQPSLIHGPGRGAEVFRNPNFGIVAWIGLPMYDADFGWGRPFYMGPAGLSFDGKAYILPTADNDGSFLVAIALQFEHMRVFEKLLYQVCVGKCAL